MAEVFLAKATGAEGIEKLLVLKRVLPRYARSEHFVSMFVDEAKVATRLNHPNIVQVFAFERAPAGFLLAMEFVDGLDLGRLIASARVRNERLPPGLAAYIVHEVSKGLDYAHKRRDSRGEPLDIVHRDVSPQNVLLGRDGIVKVADFGIAKAKLVSEEPGVIKGKFSYMSPEQAAGEPVDRRSDVYSLGVLFAELLMDRAMYPQHAGEQALEAVREGEVTFPREVDPEVPEALDRIVRRALERDPERRYQTARSMGSALGQFLHESTIMWDGAALEQWMGRVLSNAIPTSGPSLVEDPKAGRAAGEAGRRERRRVIFVAGRVRNSGDLWDSDSGGAVDEAAAGVLADLAYKNDAVLRWTGEGQARDHFRYQLGLGRTTPQDALRGVALAFDVVEALNGLSADRFSPISAAIGVARGMASIERDASGRLLHHEPVQRSHLPAELLAERGNAGTVTVTNDVHRLTRREVRYEADAPYVAPEGSPLPAFRALRPLTPDERAELVERATVLIGRAEPLSVIERAYQDTLASGRTTFLAIAGELGVGKTALVATALEGLEPAARTLTLDCAFGARDIPFSAVRDLVRVALQLTPGGGPAEAAEAHAALGRLVTDVALREPIARGITALFGAEPSGPNEPASPVDSGASGPLEERPSMAAPARRVANARDEGRPHRDADDRRATVVRAMEHLVRYLAREGPLVIWLDSLQWADSASLDLLRALSQVDQRGNVLVLLSARPDPRVERALRGVPTMRLEELAPPDAEALVRRCFEGARVPEELLRTILQRAVGNPLHIEELAESLVARGEVRIVRGAEPSVELRDKTRPIRLPSSLEEVVATRLDELDDQARTTLRWLAAAGAILDPDTLRDVAGPEVSAALPTLLEASWVIRTDSGRLAIASSVVREVAYKGAEPNDRRDMHAALAEWLEARGDAAPARLAHHLDRAGFANRSAEAYLRAADDASGLFANEDALRLYSRALELLGDGDAEARFVAHAGRERITRFLGRGADQARALASMRGLVEDHALDDSFRIFALNRRARFAVDQGRVDEAESQLEAALKLARAAREDGGALDALRLLAEVRRERGDTERALRICDDALERAGLREEFLPVRGLVLLQKGIVLVQTGRARDALATYAAATVLFRAVGYQATRGVRPGRSRASAGHARPI